MQKLHQEISKVLYRLSHPTVYMGYYGISSDPLEIENIIMTQGKGVWDGSEWTAWDHVLLNRQGLTRLPNFAWVEGDFNCNDNQLTSLKGAPKGVRASFSCNNNQLASLEEAPKYVGESFFCADNKLKSLKGSPEDLKKSFNCVRNNLINLKWITSSIPENLYCGFNPINTLRYTPKFVGANLICDNAKLISLDSLNPYLRIKGKLVVSDNPLKSLRVPNLDNIKKGIEAKEPRYCPQ